MGQAPGAGAASRVAVFKDLCADAGDAAALGRFWADVLGLTLVDEGDGDARLDPPPGAGPQRTIWVNSVPERRTAKTRLHLDVMLPSADPEPLVRLGARVVSEPEGDRRWWVLADPEGTTFCAMGPHPQYTPAAPEAFELVVDSADPWAQAQWWASVTGGQACRRDDTPEAWVEGAAGFPWRYWVFAPVPEEKTVKNRWHWDVTLDADGPSALVDRGARVLREPDEEVRWWVLADPEGNEFCAFRPAG
jgi:catechol 2,3-dioxygenase-like lactoylglutathione lyase family enzyme